MEPMMGREHGRILVVDDSRSNNTVLDALLTHEGHEVATASDGRQGLLLLNEGDYDLLLLDVMMPGLNGFEVLERVRRDYSPLQLPVIMLTAIDDPSALVRAFELGANDYVTKPIDHDVVMARVNTQLHLRALTRLKDSFLGIASHDLKKPVMLIRDIAETLSEDLVEGKPLEAADLEALQLVVRSSHYMSGIIQGFLDMQALEEGRLRLSREPFDLNAMLRRQMEGSLHAAERKGIALRCELQEVLPPLNGDDQRIAQVVDNLVGNAIKFCRPGDAIVVRSGIEGGHLRVAVCDSGPGVPEHERQRLFTRFARLSPKPTGGELSTGFGLSVCRQLVEMHHGRIGADDNPDGQGICFWFELPL